MDDETIERKRREIVARSGPWTGHNFLLAPGVYTMGSEEPEPVPGYPMLGPLVELKLRRIVQIVSDLGRAPFERLRVLDLGCHEGIFCVELASRGARVVGVEGREESVEKTRFALTALGLANAEVIQDDVRNLDLDRYGRFDVVLCLGLLYHLDSPDVFKLLESMAAVCDRLTVIETHISLAPVDRRRYRGVDYWGRVVSEGELWPLWQGIGNPDSFLPTRSSLVNAIQRAGFSSAYECYLPPEPGRQSDAVTLVALKAERASLVSTPRVNSMGWEDIPEETRRRRARPLDAVKRALPPAVRHRATRLVAQLRGRG
jgi:SAM-dependent methyltransferase